MANYEAERIGRLVDKQILSKIRLDQANKEKEVAQMKVEQAKAQMQRSQMDYSYTTITAPFDGYIDRIPYKTGSLVNPQSLLTTVSDISEIFAYYKVNESEYLEYKRQQLSGQKQHEENNVELILSDGSIYSHKGTLETVEGDFHCLPCPFSEPGRTAETWSDWKSTYDDPNGQHLPSSPEINIRNSRFHLCIYR